MEIQGAYTALITPFDAGSIDETSLRQLVERQIESGIDGLVACGTTAESATLSHIEKLRVMRIVAEQADGRVPVIAGTGTNCTSDSIQLTREASEIDGVEGALVVTPYYNKPNSAGLIAHFEAIANQGGLPVIMYNVPGRTGISMSEEVVATLAEHRQIIGIKEASGNLVYDSRLMEEVTNEDFVFLSGDDFTTFGFCALGGKGCISVVSNLMPAEMSEMCHLVINGELARAREIHYKIQPVARELFRTSNPIPVKMAASMLGWCKDEFRLPLVKMEDHELTGLREALENIGLLHAL